MRRSAQAFTLIEMLVSAVIIMILSAIAVATFTAAIENSSVKFALPFIAVQIERHKWEAYKEKAIVTVEFLEGRDEMRVTLRGAKGMVTNIEKMDSGHSFGRRLVFHAYKWPNGAKVPRTFTFLPNDNPKGGTVWLGTGFAEGKIMVDGGAIRWEK